MLDIIHNIFFHLDDCDLRELLEHLDHAGLGPGLLHAAALLVLPRQQLYRHLYSTQYSTVQCSTVQLYGHLHPLLLRVAVPGAVQAGPEYVLGVSGIMDGSVVTLTVCFYL